MLISSLCRLTPHESPDTDVILIGHSMGGILTAEVALMPTQDNSRPQPLQHRILGTLSFDVPYLGMHPSVVKTGLSSIFRPDAQTAAPPTTQPSQDPSLLSPAVPKPHTFHARPDDPNYNPSWTNDINLPNRKGWENAFHFIRKHSRDLGRATSKLVRSHYEFGSCLADYDGLKVRYCRIRTLEDEDEAKRRTVVDSPAPIPRVRFVNYYTACYGRPKPNTDQSTQDLSRTTSQQTLHPYATAPSHIENGQSGSHPSSAATSLTSLNDPAFLTTPPSEHEIELNGQPSSQSTGTPAITLNFPEPPQQPPAPPLPNQFGANFKDYKKALKEYYRDLKLYGHAMKEYHKLVHEYCTAESKKFANERKATLLAAHDQFRTLMEVKRDEAKRIASASDHNVKKKELAAVRERQKQEFDLHKEQFKRQVKEKHERKKGLEDALKREKKAGKQRARETRKAEKDIAKQERKKSQRSCTSKSPSADPSQTQDGGPIELEDNTSNAVTSGQMVEEPVEMDAASSTQLTESRIGELEGTSVENEPSRLSTQTSDSTSWQYLASTPSRAQTSSTPQASTSAISRSPKFQTKKPKDKHFCILPPRDSAGDRDPIWQRVFMEGMDEVGAHCGLFFPQGVSPSGKEHADGQDMWSERYAQLVGDVAERIEGWVQDYMTERVMSGIQEL